MPSEPSDVGSTVSRREVLGLVGVGGLAVTGIARLFKPALLAGKPRAAGEPISVERTITDESYEYNPATNRVRYPTRIGLDGEPDAFGSQSFERWARTKCAEVGSEAVLPAIRDRFETELTGIGTSVSGHPLVGPAINVSFGTTYDRDGDVISEPNVSMSDLIQTAPRTVHTTVTFADREYTRPVPVFIREVDSGLL